MKTIVIELYNIYKKIFFAVFFISLIAIVIIKLPIFAGFSKLPIVLLIVVFSMFFTNKKKLNMMPIIYSLPISRFKQYLLRIGGKFAIIILLVLNYIIVDSIYNLFRADDAVRDYYTISFIFKFILLLIPIQEILVDLRSMFSTKATVFRELIPGVIFLLIIASTIAGYYFLKVVAFILGIPPALYFDLPFVICFAILMFASNYLFSKRLYF